MNYKAGDILLIKFPFTNLTKAKKRPVLVIQSENELGDFICFQITSKSTSDNLVEIETENLNDGVLKLVSYVKYDKCFTLNSEIIDKKLASVNKEFIQKIRELFCNEMFL
jgi:mRNA interferase MazF